MNKSGREKVKSQNSVGLFKIETHLKYLQDVARSYLCPIPLSVWWFDIFQKGIDSESFGEMVLVYYIFDDKFFSEFLNVQINV